MTESLQIIELGNPILQQRSHPVVDVRSDRVQKLIADLMLTVRNANGVGIAAPQVAQPDRLFIVASRPTPRYPNAPEMEPTAIINPRFLAHSDEVVKDWEGCLSVPGIRGLVPRYQAIEVEYTGQNGKLYRQEMNGFVARIFQHELDHLDGIVFLARVESVQDLMSEKEYQERIVQANERFSSKE
ncbi:MAG: peptide deformylase [Leptolyngbyaceae cyanobacterium HOT.MB2.61]|jgi:peptide deformylase|nr:peptide deformylase [Leptolyngbyaceae cyanobacterium HOT.MB2.61]